MNKIQTLIAQHCPNGVEYKKLGEICDLVRGRVMSKEYLKNNIGNYPVYSSQTSNNGIFGFINTYDYDCESITWTTDGAKAGSVFYHKDEKFSITNVCGLLRAKKSAEINMRFLFYILQISTKSYVNEGMGNPKLMSNVMASIPIPIPPIPVQEEIVRILDVFTQSQTELQKQLQIELELRKKQYKYYRDKLLCFEDIDGGGGLNVEYRTLGEIGMRNHGTKITAEQMKKLHRDNAPIRIFAGGSTIADIEEESIPKKDIIYKPSIIVKSRGYIGFEYYEKPFSHKNEFWSYTIEDNNINQKFVFYYLQTQKEKLQKIASNSMKIPQLSTKHTDNLKIPIPPLEEQKRIVGILDKFDGLVSDISIGIPAEIEMRKKQYEYYRDSLLRFEEV